MTQDSRQWVWLLHAAMWWVSGSIRVPTHLVEPGLVAIAFRIVVQTVCARHVMICTTNQFCRPSAIISSPVELMCRWPMLEPMATGGAQACSISTAHDTTPEQPGTC